MCGDAGRAAGYSSRNVVALMVALSVSVPAALMAQQESPTIGGPGVYGAGEHTFYCALYTEPEDAPMLGVGRRPTEGERGRLINVQLSIQRLREERRTTVTTSRDVENEICLANLFEPGIYELASETTTNSWIWIDNPDASSPTVTRLLRRGLGLKLFRSVYQIEIDDAPVTVEPEPECESSPSLVVELPKRDTFVAFDDSEAGRLEIQLSASVSGDVCEGAEVHWSAEEIPGSTKSFVSADGSPTNVGEDVTLVYEGLPEHNREFGPKTIRATVGSTSKTVPLQVFFDSSATNHGGEGNGETPNWFYYWRQTSAGIAQNWYWATPPPDAPPHYDEQNRVLTLTDARYDKDCGGIKWGGSSHFGGYSDPNGMDHITVCDDARKRLHFTRTGRTTWGIDTYGIVLMHEWQHKINFEAWGWDTLHVRWYDDKTLWSNGEWNTDAWEDAVEEVDGVGDVDGIPAKDWDAILARLGFELEHHQVWEVQRAWVMGSADDEDWSECGKQWRKKYPNSCPKLADPIER